MMPRRAGPLAGRALIAAVGNYSNGWIAFDAEVPGAARSITLTMHQGSINGFSAVIYRNLETRDLVVILNNVGTNGSEWRIGETLMTMLASAAPR